ncbi:hypothetical protein OG439_06975 [Amycolatopsis sp. NBC_01307]|uniref:hypothetical protein n=1 Tax=Amycolatopsis sp. NBC_01307 TaxID=2903561 RepID=UPI002E10F162|nr:hypothetical protein OG439_06975 [Amycolatopsis sp. NBC_01307]
MGDDNNTHGFTQDDNGVWPDSSNTPTNSTGDPGKDFDGLTWKQIEAAILGGGSMAPGQDQADQAYGNVNWQSLQAAAGVFQTTQMSLAVVAEAVQKQVEALAGEDGPWKGTAATNFKGMMNDMASKFQGLVHQISDGSSGGRNIPNQLANSAAYLQWAQNTLRYIDSYYAQQVIARGKVLNDGRAYISQFPDAVEMMTNDMRQVGNQLSGKYHSFSVASYTAPPPATPPPVDVPPPPPPPEAPPPPDIPPPADAPPPPAIPPPPGGSGGGGGGDVPPPELPPPPGDTGGGGGGGTPPPLSSAEIPPPPGGDSGLGGDGGGTPPPFQNLAVAPPPGAGGDSGTGGPGGPGDLGAINPPSLDGPPGDVGAGGGALPPLTSPNLTPPPSGAGGKDDQKAGGLGDIKPPALDSPPGDVGAGGLGDIKSPSFDSAPGDVGAGGGAGGLNGLGDLKSPALGNPPGAGGLNGLGANALNPADVPSSLQDPKAGGGFTSPMGGGMPMMPPGGMGGGMNPAGSERPDSAGLLGGVDKPWTSSLPDGLGDPSALTDAPALKSASWSAPPGDVGGAGGVGDVGGAGGVGDVGGGALDPGGIKGLDPSQLQAPGDLSSSNGGQQQGMPGSGMPMMPPGGMGGGMNPTGAERPDSAGLLGGVDAPWDSALPDGLGDPSSFGETPALESASWSAPPGDVGGAGGAGDVGGLGAGVSDPGGIKGLDPSQLQAPGGLSSSNGGQQQGMPGSGMPMMPPGGMGGGMNPTGAERPDSAGLLGGVDAPWTADVPDGLGDPSSFGETPALQSASWSAPPSDVGGAGDLGGADAVDPGGVKGLDASQLQAPGGLSSANSPQQQAFPGSGMPMMPPGGMGGGANPSGAERPDSAGLLGGIDAPWTPDAPTGVGDPTSVGETPALGAASWSSPASWAAPSTGDSTPAAPGMPMTPPGGMGGGANPPGAERPDSAGLLGSVDAAWTPDTPSGTGDPTSVGETPALGAASWSHPAPPGGVGGGIPAAPRVDTPRTPEAPPAAGPGVPAMPMMPPPMTPPDNGATAERPDSAGLLGGDSSAWATADTPGEPDPGAGTPRGWATAVPVSGWGTAPVGKSTSDDHDDDVRISVVRPVESSEDTSAWDVGTAEFLPGLLPFGAVAPAGESEVDVSTDIVERSDEPWRPAEDEPRETYRRIRVGDGEFIPDELPTCGDGPALGTEAEAPEPEPEEEPEEEERTMADLLSQDDSAWGRPASRPSGVLE